MPVDTQGRQNADKHQSQLLLSPVPVPLELRRQSVRAITRRRRKLKGPWRALRLCLLGILLPAILVAVPIYMRSQVYGDQVYPVAMADMRLLDSRVSTTWCQRQLVRGNTTFNAFLLPEQPKVEPEPVHLSMSRDLWLEDDAKEYWAFYMLKGSAITVSTCVRGPGASLIVIRGHKHLHDCAYIGDNSSEELDELEQAAEEAESELEKGGQWPLRNSSEARSNEPRTMRRARPGVSFHGAHPLNSGERLDHHDSSETDEETSNMLGHLLGKVAHARLKAAPEVPPQPRKRPSTLRHHHNSTSHVPKADNLTSSEVFEDILRKLQKLGPRGRNVLKKVNKQLGGDGGAGAKGPKNGGVRRDDDDDLDALRSLVREILNEDPEPTRGRHHKSHARKQEEPETNLEDRIKRHITLSSPGLMDSLTEHDEDGDVALEDLDPDGIADHHETLNETTAGDFSKSEFWSSFSSSEEALLSCAGLILNLPLTPHRGCQQHSDPHLLTSASHVNTLTYRVPRNGYYFFVYSSENEIEQNYIHAHFELEKKVYNVSNSMAACNSTEECSLALDFFSSEKVVLEVPFPSNDSLLDAEYIVISTCEPRTAIYITCVVAVPLLIVIFAFQ